jgi:adipocyte plasma membrane-associated protein
VTKNGDIFFTSSSSEFGMNDGAFSLFVNPSGRLMHLERKTGRVSVILDNLFFANGVVLSPNEEFVLVAETHASRIQKYYLNGEKKGQSEIFAEGLPGLPDNMTPDNDGVWIPLVAAADPENPCLPQSMTKLPLVRKFVVRVLHLIELPFKLISDFYPNPYTKKIAHRIGGFAGVSSIQPDRSTIIRADWNGKIIGSLHGFDGSVRGISHVAEFNDYLYFGSPYNNYIGRVKFVNKDKIHPQTVAPKPPPTTTQAPTTTQKPVTTTTTTRAPVRMIYI